MEKKIGYKAYYNGVTFLNKQYHENEIVEEDENKILEKGVYYCLNPLDTLNYYPLVDSECELTKFTTVEPLDEELKEDNSLDTTRYCEKIKINTKLSLEEFIKASFDYINDLAKEGNKMAIFKDKEYSKIAKSKEYSLIASSGDYSQIAINDQFCEVVAIGSHSKITSNGAYSKIISIKFCSSITTNGVFSKIVSCGDYSYITINGDFSELVSKGDYSQIAINGGYSYILVCGYHSKVVSNGNGTSIALNGKNNVGVSMGVGGRIKGTKGSWITLAEYDIDNNCICVKTAQIDGEILKENTWYELKNGEFIVSTKLLKHAFN